MEDVTNNKRISCDRSAGACNSGMDARQHNASILNPHAHIAKHTTRPANPMGDAQLHQFRAGTPANGMYFYRMITEDGSIHNKKLILSR